MEQEDYTYSKELVYHQVYKGKSNGRTCWATYLGMEMEGKNKGKYHFKEDGWEGWHFFVLPKHVQKFGGKPFNPNPPIKQV